MPEDSTEVIDFERVSGSQTRGCIAYLLMVPMFAFIGSLVGGFAGVGLMWVLKVGNATQDALAIPFFAMGGIGFAAWGIRDYFRRAGNRVRVHPEHLEVCSSKTSEVYRFADLKWIEGPSSTELSLKCAGHPPVVFKAEEWPLPAIYKALARTAVPRMVRSLNSRIEAGEILEFCPANQRAVRLGVGGLGLVALALYLFYRWMFVLVAERSVFQLGVPVFLAGLGATWLVHSGQARGGVLIEKAGIRRRKDDPVTPWQKVREVKLGENGARIELDNGEVILVGLLTRNYEACRTILRTWAVTTD